jgi:16S rRNA (adenine1518-N6/adenine1519-N6)-dimethyltransferase
MKPGTSPESSTGTPRHRPRKRFGQNFLVDRSVIDRIVDAIAPRPAERIVEIGPGHGALTTALLRVVDRLEVIEIDRDLAAELAGAHPPERLHIHVADALQFDFGALPGRFRMVGNLPYNISSPLLFRLLEFADRIDDIHVMLQKEVVDRMIAHPGSSDYGRLSVMLQYRFRIERLFKVAPGSFRPVPKVDSAVARLVPHPTPPHAASDPALFARVVGLAFGQRRKTLRNALSTIADEAAMARAGIDPRARGEILSIEQFVALANVLGRSEGRS